MADRTRDGRHVLKAFLLATVVLVVLALAAGFLLNAEFAEASSDRHTIEDSVRLDPGMRSDWARGDDE